MSVRYRYFSVNQKLRDFNTDRPALKKIMKMYFRKKEIISKYIGKYVSKAK